MKYFIIVMILSLIGVSALLITCRILPVFGNGNLETSERTLAPFEKIRSGGSAEVRFHASREYKAIVTTDSNLLETITTDIRNNTLIVGTNNSHCLFTKLLIDVYCPVLDGISISGSGSFSSENKIISADFASKVSGSGNINMTIECDNYSADISGSGKINTDIICNSFKAVISGSGDILISGTGNSSNIQISGSGKFDGIEFKNNNVIARISGSGKMNIWALESINANISGSGSIKYRGTPRIEFNGSGSGKIKPE